MRWYGPERWHVTLRFLGDCDARAAIVALGSVAHGVVSARFGPAVERLGRDVVCLPVGGVESLVETVVAATAAIGQPARADFVGHLTLGRLRRGGDSELVGRPFEAEMTVTEVVLMGSELRSDGARHSVLARHPLG